MPLGRTQLPRDEGVEPTLTIVVVNHNSWADVARLIEGFGHARETAEGRCELVVIDNASDDRMPADLQINRPWLRIVLRDENEGFATGVNAGWRSARGRWLLLLNPDVVAGPEFLTRVLDRIAHHEFAQSAPPAVVGFALRNPDGSRQPSVGADPSLLRTVIEAFLPRSRRKYKAVWRHKPGPVPWVTGACALVDRAAMDAVGGMDEDFFLYYEEVAFCRSAQARGLRVAFDPGVEVVHLRPLQNRAVSPAMRVITRHSRMLFFQKHQSRWQFFVTVALTRAEATVRGVWNACRRRAQDREAWRIVGEIAQRMAAGEVIGRKFVCDQIARRLRQSPHKAPVSAQMHRRSDRDRAAVGVGSSER